MRHRTILHVPKADHRGGLGIEAADAACYTAGKEYHFWRYA